MNTMAQKFDPVQTNQTFLEENVLASAGQNLAALGTEPQFKILAALILEGT